VGGEMKADTIRELALVSSQGEPVSNQLSNSLILMAWTPFLVRFANNVIERFLYDSDQYITNDASRKAHVNNEIADELERLANMSVLDRNCDYLLRRAAELRGKK
jgi:hypothetical protein